MGSYRTTLPYSACARRIQFPRTHSRDSVPIVIPFMHVTNYVTRYLATLEPLELQLPFAHAFGQATVTIFQSRLYNAI